MLKTTKLEDSKLIFTHKNWSYIYSPNKTILSADSGNPLGLHAPIDWIISLLINETLFVNQKRMKRQISLLSRKKKMGNNVISQVQILQFFMEASPTCDVKIPPIKK